MSGEVQHLSRSEFASAQGWSPSYVTKLGKQGRLVLDESGKLVDVAATLAVLKRTDDPGKAGVKDHHAAGRSEKFLRPEAPIDPAPAAADPRYWENKARREGAMAELAELELAKKRGELVERSRVESAAFAIGRMLRDSVLGVPVQLAPQLVGMVDAFAVEQAMRDALRRVLEDHARMTADDVARSMEATH